MKKIPYVMTKLSCRTLAIGARQLVVHEALETTLSSALYSLWLTPNTKRGVSSFGGADIMTFFAPPPKCFEAVSVVRDFPVD